MQDTDKHGNVLFLTENSDVMLKLKSGGKVRNIGRLYYSEQSKCMVYFKQYDPERHVYKKLSALGFCWQVIRKLADHDIVRVQNKVTGAMFQVSAGILRERGTQKNGKAFLHHLDSGFELQVFLPLSQFEAYA